MGVGIKQTGARADENISQQPQQRTRVEEGQYLSGAKSSSCELCATSSAGCKARSICWLSDDGRPVQMESRGLRIGESGGR